MKRWLLRTMVGVVGLTFAGKPASAQEARVMQFTLAPNPKVVDCLARFPGDAANPPTARVRVVRLRDNDVLAINVQNVKPGLHFDLFTVQHSQFLADGTKDSDFKNFGLAWYQADLQADALGTVRGLTKTILLDKIFGFDPAAKLAPTNAFHVGFWFDDPNDAVPCGFDPDHPTPFNEVHKAGPLAMISLPDAETGLGPLCTNPDTSVTPARCIP